MNTFAGLLLCALLAITADNVIFAGGAGLSRVLRAARKPKTMVCYSAFVAFFTLVSMLLAILFNQKLLSSKTLIFYRPAVLAACAAVVYLLAAFILKTWAPRLYRKSEPILSPAAINCIVISMPYLQRILKLSPLEAVGFALGTGVAFFLAVLVLSAAMPNLKNPDAPKAFRGLPSLFIYAGILSMALLGLSKGGLFS